MKPLITLTILSRDPMDPTTLDKVGVIAIEAIGDGTIILTRDEMGAIIMEAVEVKPTPGYLEAIDEATKTLAELHAKLGETHVATNHAMTDMFYIHKLLTR